MPTSYTASNKFCYGPKVCTKVSKQAEIMNNIAKSSNYPMIKQGNFTTIYITSVYLVNNIQTYKASQIGAVSFTEVGTKRVSNRTLHYVNYVVHANYSALHASPLFNTIVSSAIITSIDPTASLTVSLFPLPLTSTQKDIYSNFNIYLVVIFLMLSISVIPASFATHIVREREIKAKHQQVVSGVSYIVYWISNWIW
jgi:hypothetical protein